MKLFFRSLGDGPVLMILHGLYGSSDNWMTIARNIQNKFRIIIPDLRNHGQSPHSPEHTYRAMAQDIRELADDLHLGKFSITGHSMGGRIAAGFALEWPDRINSLIIGDISPFSDGNSASKAYDFHKGILETILSVDPSEFSSRPEIEAHLIKGISSEKIRGFIMKNVGRNTEGKFEWKLNGTALMNNLDEITRGIMTVDESRSISGFPVTFLKGEMSDYLASDDYKTIRGLFPAAEFITIKNAGHWLHADNPEAVIDAILTYS